MNCVNKNHPDYKLLNLLGESKRAFFIAVNGGELPNIATASNGRKSLMFEKLVQEYGENIAVELKAMYSSNVFKNLMRTEKAHPDKVTISDNTSISLGLKSIKGKYSPLANIINKKLMDKKLNNTKFSRSPQLWKALIDKEYMNVYVQSAVAHYEDHPPVLIVNPAMYPEDTYELTDTVILHESVHLLLDAIIDSPKNITDEILVDELTTLFRNSGKYLRDFYPRAYDNLQEFVAYALTDPKFQTELNNLEDDTKFEDNNLTTNISLALGVKKDSTLNALIKSVFGKLKEDIYDINGEHKVFDGGIIKDNYGNDILLNDKETGNKNVIESQRTLPKSSVPYLYDKGLFYSKELFKTLPQIGINTNGFTKTSPQLVKNILGKVGIYDAQVKTSTSGATYIVLEKQIVQPSKVINSNIPSQYNELSRFTLEGLRKTSQKLSERFNIKFKIISMQEAAKLIEDSGAIFTNQKGFYNHAERTAYIISGMADETTAVHEIFTHPFLNIIKERDKDLYDSLYEEAVKIPGIYEFIQSNYKGLSDEEKSDEMIAKAIDLAVRDNLDKEILTKGLWAKVKRFFNEMMSLIEDLINIPEGTLKGNYNLTINKIAEFAMYSDQSLDLNISLKEQKDYISAQSSEDLEMFKKITNNLDNINLTSLTENNIIDRKEREYFKYLSKKDEKYSSKIQESMDRANLTGDYVKTLIRFKQAGFKYTYTDVYNDILSNSDKTDKEPQWFKLTQQEFKKVEKTATDIIKNAETRNKNITGTNNSPKIYIDKIVKDSNNLSGKIDVLIVYGDGTVDIFNFAAIMTYKFKKYEVDVPLQEQEIWDSEFVGYKKILSSLGVTKFGNTRILPVNINFKKDKFYSLEVDPYNENKYLQPIPVADETTKYENLNLTLNKLFLQKRKLIQQIKNSSGNEKKIAEMNLKNINNIIKDIQVNLDFKSLVNEIKIIESEFNNFLINQGKRPDFNKLYELYNYIKIYEQSGTNAIDALKDTKDDKLIDELEKLSYKIEKVKRDIANKIIERINGTFSKDILKGNKEIGFMGSLFNQLSEFDIPSFEVISQVVRTNASRVLNDFSKDAEILDKVDSELKKWVSSKGMTMLEAFDKIINKNKGSLISKVGNTFFEDREKAIKTKNVGWFIENTNIELKDGVLSYTGEYKTRFDEAKAKYFKMIDEQFSSKDAEKINKESKEKWESRYDISKNLDALFNNDNRYMGLKDNVKYYSEAYEYIKQSGNEPLLNYFETLRELNKKWSDLIDSEDIIPGFIANIRQSMVDKIAQVGVKGAFDLKNLLHKSLEVTENDVMHGAIDPKTGKPLHRIPLNFSAALVENLNAEEKAKVVEDTTAKYNAYIKEKGYIYSKAQLDSWIEAAIAKEQRNKGLKHKSYDLTKVFKLFSESVYTYHHYKKSEILAKSILEVLKDTQNTESEIKDSSGKRMFDSISQKAKTFMGIPPSTLSLLEDYIDQYWYGKSVKGDSTTYVGRTYDEEGNIIEAGKTLSGRKLTRNILQWTSATAMGLKPILAAGNFLGGMSNTLMTASEGMYYTKDSLNKAIKQVTKMDNKYRIAREYFKTRADNYTYRQATNSSASLLSRTLTLDNMFIMHRKGDHFIDDIVLMAMMQSYGIQDGKITKIEGKDIKSLYDLMDVKDDKVVIPDLNEKEYVRFRTMVQKTINKIKGTMPDEDRNSINRTVFGEVLMQFRNWMPGLIKNRFNSLKYDDIYESFDVGRFRVFFGEFTKKGLMGSLNEFIKLFSEVATFGLLKTKTGNIDNTNNDAAKYYFAKFLNENPDLKGRITFEQFKEVRLKKLRGMAKELEIYLAFYVLVTGLKAAIPDDDEEYLSSILSKNAYRTAQRGLLEISFFFDLTSVTQILKSPIPSLTTFTNMYKAIGNTVDEVRDLPFEKDYKGLMFWEEDKKDKQPILYYTSSIFPISNSIVDLLDLFDKTKIN